MAKLNYSRQRKAILDYLCNTTSHPTAEEVYRHIQKVYPNISLGTVYRNLSLLVAQGQAKKIQGDDCDHFDGKTALHYHFICNSCHHVYDICMKPSIELNATAAECFPGKIFGHSTLFYGICESCMNTECKND